MTVTDRQRLPLLELLKYKYHLDSLGADEVPSEYLVIVSDADDVIRAGPAHAGHQLRVLGLLDVRGLEPHPRHPSQVSDVDCVCVSRCKY